MGYKIYVHINKTNGKIYIGQTKFDNLNRRWNTDGSGYKTNKHFWNSIQKYGWDNFEHIVLFENLSLEEANLIEEELIKKYDSTNPNKGYNLRFGGRNSSFSEEMNNDVYRGTTSASNTKDNLRGSSDYYLKYLSSLSVICLGLVLLV